MITETVEAHVARLSADLARVTAERDTALSEAMRVSRLVVDADAERDLALAAEKDSADALSVAACEAVRLREALGLAREYVSNAANRLYDGTQGHAMRAEAMRRLGVIGEALSAPSTAAAQVERMKAEAREAGYEAAYDELQSEHDKQHDARVREDERAEAVDLYRRRRVVHRDTERGREVVGFDAPEEWLAGVVAEAVAPLLTRVAMLTEALAVNQPWPVTDMLDNLATAAVHLTQDHNCDAHGWELVINNIGRVRVAVRDLRVALAATPESIAEWRRGLETEARRAALKAAIVAIDDTFALDEDVSPQDVISTMLATAAGGETKR